MKALHTKVDKHLRRVDLLQQTILNEPAVVERSAFGLIANKPWAKADFGSLLLAPGWWRLSVGGGQVSNEAELVLRSPSDPHISVSLVDAGDIRLLLRGRDPYEISLLLSYWPGEFHYSHICLERLSFPETIALVARHATSMAGSGNFLVRLHAAVRRMTLGAAVGVRKQKPDVSNRAADVADSGITHSERRFKIMDLGELSALVREGDELHPAAAAIAQVEFASNKALRTLYADTLEGARLVPKPGWDAVLAENYDYVDTPVFVRSSDRALLEVFNVGTAHQPGLPVGRVALPLARRIAGRSVKIVAPEVERVADQPLVSVLIPTKLRTDLLERCLTSLQGKTVYGHKEIIIVDNGSVDPRFDAVLEAAGLNMKVTRLEDFGEFNFSRLMNLAASRASGDLLLLLNDDVEALQPDWLDRLVDSALRPDVGIVGARLVYPDGSIQHAGVALGIGGVCGHIWKNVSSADASSNPYIMCPSQRSAVTGACLMIRRQTYLDVGGMDLTFPVNYGDIDLCLRVRQAGLKVVYRGDACLIHHESKSVGSGTKNYKRAKMNMRAQREFMIRWGEILKSDPHSSPAYDPLSEAGFVRPQLLNSIFAP